MGQIVSKCPLKATHCIESKQGNLGAVSLNGKSLNGPLKVQLKQPGLE